MIRGQRGYALTSTLVLGMAAIAFLLALAQYVTSSNLNQSLLRRRMELRTAAEVGLDYGICYLNDALKTSDYTKLDPEPIALPSNYLKLQSGPLSSNGDRISVTITVRQPGDSTQLENWCSIYSPPFDPSETYNVNEDLKQYWRVMESTASFTGTGMSKTLRTVLRPESSIWLTEGVADSSVLPATLPASATPRPYFAQGMVSDSSFRFAPPSGNTLLIQGAGGPTVTGSPSDGYDYSLTISSNSVGSVETGASLQGNIAITGDISNNNVLSNGGEIQGRATVNGTTDASVKGTTGALPGPTDNVLANADLNQGLPARVGNNQNPKVQNLDASSALAATAVPAPSAPSTATALPQLSSMTSDAIGSGNYSTNALTTSGASATILVGDTAEPTNVSRFFVEDTNGATGPAVSIDTGKFQNATGDARSMQIWYSGTRPININIADNAHPFQGLIYAPNATITTTGTGTFDGALVGKMVNAQHSGEMNLRTDLSDVSSSSAGMYNSKLGLRFATKSSSDATNIPFYYRSETYEER